MSHTEIVAYIGAAAWLPIVFSWIYKQIVQPKITVVTGEFPDIGFTTFGPIVNLRLAITADRKAAVIDSFSLVLTHEKGDSTTFHWVGMTEEVNQVIDEKGVRQRIEKEQTAIALHVGVESLLEKFVKFQSRSFVEATQPSIEAISEKLHFAQKKDSRPSVDLCESEEFEELKRMWAREFNWQAGRYRGEFRISSPTKVSLSQSQIEFHLSDTDIEILKRNLETCAYYNKALIANELNGKDIPNIKWEWRSPRIIKIRHEK